MYFCGQVMRKLKIGIVGLGWLGLELGKSFQKSKHSVWGTVRSDQKAKELSGQDMSVHPWQFPEEPSASILALAMETDVLILTLPPSNFTKEDPKNYAEVLNAWKERCSAQTKIIYTSSIGVYPDDLENATEDSSLKENHPIVLAENTLLKNTRSRVTILRLAGLIGEDRNPVRFLVKKEENDTPSKPVNLIHRLDIIGVIKMILEKNYFGEILNVVHPNHPSRREYYCKMAELLNLPTPQFTQKEEKMNYKVVNCSKLASHLGYNQFLEL
jgi:nucleoside-diphosphate-sugar epimerase